MIKKTICLFDVDGTLTKSRLSIERPMIQTLKKISNFIDIAVVGGSDLIKMKEQLGQETINLCKYVFSQNGLLAFEKKTVIGSQSIKDHLGQDKLKKFINFCLKYLSQIDIPIKRGTFIEYRTGLINISPIGRNCSQKQREQFEQFDKQHKIRQKFIQVLKKQFKDYELNYSIGGQISFDVVPIGWDKTYCLRYLKEYDDIYFFGDKTYEGGNDYQIYIKIKPTGKAYTITNGPSETIEHLTDLFL